MERKINSFIPVTYCPSFHSTKTEKKSIFSFVHIFSVPGNCFIGFNDSDIRLINKQMVNRGKKKNEIILEVERVFIHKVVFFSSIVCPNVNETKEAIA